MKGHFERWDLIESVLDEVIDTPTGQRSSVLDEACGHDDALRKEVEGLLELINEAKACAYLDKPVAVFAEALVEHAFDLAEDMTGRRIGPYQIKEEIGRGGMGTVYLAERIDGQFEQQVVLKLIKRGMDSEEILKRFQHERQILAKLHHPNIAPLLDGGLTREGQPYFAMEYVDGESLTQYCDRKQLPIKERLVLFQSICQAIQYAHRNLIVHRDLKPANILVTEDGTVKLLDFGIAKMLGTEEEGLTEENRRVMTLHYGSPEQIRGEPITTAIDIYALGVILYELLTGHGPYHFEDSSLSEVERVILTVEPEKPSVVVSRIERAVPAEPGQGSAETVGLARRTDTARLRRQLAGDLDNILLKALQKEPERRYQTVEQFAEDLNRHLSGLPVTARQDTYAYRIKKFIRRHPFEMTAATLAILALLVGIIGIWWQVTIATQERDRAQAEALKAEGVSALLIDMFDVSDPFSGADSGSDTMRVRDFLDRGARRVRTNLEGQPDILAQMLEVIGRVYLNLAMYEEADTFLAEALETSKAHFGTDHPSVAASLSNYAMLLRRRGKVEEADTLYRQALAMARRLLGEEDLIVAGIRSNLGLLLHERTAYPEAESLLVRSLATRRALHSQEHEDVAESLNNLGNLLGDKGDLKQAESLLREALAMRRHLYGKAHPYIANSLNNLAGLLRKKGDLEEAERLYRENLTMRRQLLGDEHPYVATGMNNMAIMLRQKGDLDASEALFREALIVYKKTFGPKHPRVGLIQFNLALVLNDKMEYEEAEMFCRHSLELFREAYGEKHGYVATVLNALGGLLRERGDYSEAELLLRQALVLRKTLYGEEHHLIASTIYNLALLLYEKEDFEAAESMHRQALAMNRKLLGENHTNVATSLSGLAKLLRKKGEYQEAELLYRDALAIFQRNYPKGHVRTANVLLGLSLLHLEQERMGEVEALLNEALAIRVEKSGDDDWRTAEVKSAMGYYFTMDGQFEKAESLLTDSYAVLSKAHSQADESMQKTRDRLIDLYDRWGKTDKAAAMRADSD